MGKFVGGFCVGSGGKIRMDLVNGSRSTRFRLRAGRHEGVLTSRNPLVWMRCAVSSRAHGRDKCGENA